MNTKSPKTRGYSKEGVPCVGMTVVIFESTQKKELNFYSQLLYKPVIIMQKISAKGWGYHDRYGGYHKSVRGVTMDRYAQSGLLKSLICLSV